LIAVRDESGSRPGGGPSASGSCSLSETNPAADSLAGAQCWIWLAPALRGRGVRPGAPPSPPPPPGWRGRRGGLHPALLRDAHEVRQDPVRQPPDHVIAVPQ